MDGSKESTKRMLPSIIRGGWGNWCSEKIVNPAEKKKFVTISEKDMEALSPEGRTALTGSKLFTVESGVSDWKKAIIDQQVRLKPFELPEVVAELEKGQRTLAQSFKARETTQDGEGGANLSHVCVVGGKKGSSFVQANKRKLSPHPHPLSAK